MSIPIEAIEAAAKQMWRDSEKGRRTCEAWEGLDEQERRPMLESAHRVLEAATPRLLEGAWSEGHEDGYWNSTLSDGNPNALTEIDHAAASNPYREKP